MYELKINGKFVKTYATLKGVKIAYGKFLKQIDKGIIPITVADGETFISWRLIK